MILNEEKVKQIIASRPESVYMVVIIMDNICNADCKVCVAKHRIKNDTCKDLCTKYTVQCARCCDRIATDNEYYAKLEDLLEQLRGKNVQYVVTGGEPTLSSRLKLTLGYLLKNGATNIIIETNGSNLLDEDVIAQLIKSKARILYSRYALDDMANTKAFGGCSDIYSNDDVKKVVSIYRNKFIMNCILMQDCVDSGKKLLEYQTYYKELGINNFVYSELMFDTNLKDTNKEIYQAYTDSLVKIEDVAADLQELGYVKLMNQGSSFKVLGLQKDNKWIFLSRADMSKIPKEHQNNELSTKFLVYPSGDVGVHSIED